MGRIFSQPAAQGFALLRRSANRLCGRQTLGVLLEALSTKKFCSNGLEAGKITLDMQSFSTTPDITRPAGLNYNARRSIKFHG